MTPLEGFQAGAGFSGGELCYAIVSLLVGLACIVAGYSMMKGMDDLRGRKINIREWLLTLVLAILLVILIVWLVSGAG